MSQRQDAPSALEQQTLDLGLSDLVRALEQAGSEQESGVELDRYHQYLKLVDAAQYQQLLELTEQDLKELGEQDFIARLFWIRANIDCGQFPRGMLGVSFQRLLSDLCNNAEAYGQLIARYSNSMSLINQMVTELQAQLLEAPNLCAELSNLANNLESPSHLAGLEMSVVSDEVAELPAEDSVSDSLAQRWTWRSVPVLALVKGLAVLLAPCAIYLGWLEYRQAAVSESTWRFLGTLHGSEFQRESLRVWHRVEYQQVWDKLGREPKLLAPSIARILNIGELNGLSYSLEEPTLSTKPIAVESKGTKEVLAKVKKLTPAAPLPIVNTSSPLEPYRVEPELDQRQEDQRGSTRFPRSKNFVTEHFVSDQRSVDDFRARRFDYYQIVVDTSVFARPTLAAPRLSDLMRGDRIFVEEDTGRWLTVRSKSGNIGFVLKRDATPALDG